MIQQEIILEQKIEKSWILSCWTIDKTKRYIEVTSHVISCKSRESYFCHTVSLFPFVDRPDRVKLTRDVRALFSSALCSRPRGTFCYVRRPGSSSVHGACTGSVINRRVLFVKSLFMTQSRAFELSGYVWFVYLEADENLNDDLYSNIIH